MINEIKSAEEMYDLVDSRTTYNILGAFNLERKMAVLSNTSNDHVLALDIKNFDDELVWDKGIYYHNQEEAFQEFKRRLNYCIDVDSFENIEELKKMLESGEYEVINFSRPAKTAILKNNRTNEYIIASGIFKKNKKVSWDNGTYYPSGDLKDALRDFHFKACDCTMCVNLCPHRSSYRRLPKEYGGLGLCKRY